MPKRKTKYRSTPGKVSGGGPPAKKCAAMKSGPPAMNYAATKSEPLALNALDEFEYATAALTALHGAPARKERGTILDNLVRTILSQNTTDRTSARAFASLKAAFPTWEVFEAGDDALCEESIRVGGLAEIKCARIKAILRALRAERGAMCLEYAHNLDDEAVKAELSRFKGVGPKTVSCVMMFAMDRADFPVDTHVWHIAKKLRWVGQSVGREECYDILNAAVPAHLKYDLHVLLVLHGKCCRDCAKGGKLQLDEVKGDCPLKLSNLKQANALLQQLATPQNAKGVEGGGASTTVKTEATAAQSESGGAPKRPKAPAPLPVKVKQERVLPEAPGLHVKVKAERDW